MNKLIIMLLALLPCALLAQPKRITVRQAGMSYYYTTVDSAYFYAQSGDTLIFPGGDFPVPPGNNGWLINRRLHILGAGYRPDSSAGTGATRIIGLVTLGNAADGGSVHGIHFMQNMNFQDTLSNYLINRCAITEWVELSPNSHHITFRESMIFKASNNYHCFYGENASHVTFFNCIFYNGMQEVGQGSVFENCIFHVSSITTCNYASFKNCIFINNYGIGNYSGYNTYVNCIFPNAPNISGTNSTFNCINNANMANMFFNISNANIISNNYRLKPNTPGGPGGPAYTNPAIGAGINGTDCGVYGGAFPLKPNAHPIHPRIKSLIVAPATDANGNLNVQVKVEAQNN
ncbi:MAG: hypothetical protein NW241_12590 [Bacteroidia bacterium]|nr:hypothetical protein [Bacteroidia bacterium]